MYLHNKKIDYVKTIFILFLLFLTSNTAHAISGACSSHNGVNCSSGADSNGKVVCNDGWTNSSVYFSDTDECKTKSLCVYVEPIGCNSESDYDNLSNQEQERLGGERALLGNAGMLGEISGQSELENLQKEFQNKLDNCRKDINNNASWLLSYNECLKNKSVSENNIQSTSAINENAYIQSKMNEYCVQEKGVGSVWDSKTNFCSNIVSPEPITPTTIAPEVKTITPIKQATPIDYSVIATKYEGTPTPAPSLSANDINSKLSFADKIVSVSNPVKNIKEQQPEVKNQSQLHNSTNFFSNVWSYFKNILKIK